MSLQVPTASQDGWELRHGRVPGSGGEAVRYLERPGRKAGHVERYYPDGLGYGSGYEVGGGLWGHRDGNTLVIRFATQKQPGGYGGESTSSVRMSLDSLTPACQAYRDLAELLGDWHPHEAYEGDRARPSQADLAGWAAGVGEDRLYVGLILSKSTDDSWRGDAAWLWPRFSAWVARKTATGTVIEPARLMIDTGS